MERVYVVTPEMRGLTWPYLSRNAAVRGGLYLLAAILFSVVLKGKWTISISAALVGLIIDFALALTVRFGAPQQLRATDVSIEEINGPVIRKNELVMLNEHNDSEPKGLEVVGKRSPRWLPNYRIFVPASLEGFSELRQFLHGWAGAAKD